VDPQLAKKLVQLAQGLRALKDHDLEEAASTRLLVYTIRLIQAGYDPLEACRSALIEPLTDDLETADALMEVVHATFGHRG
jgi:nitric oxide reductase NorQ protein